MRTAASSKRNTEQKSPSRFIGLGQTPSDACIGAAIKCPFNLIPVIEYLTVTTQLPLTDTQIAETFGDKISLTQDFTNGPVSVDSSFIITGLLQCTMLCHGFGIHLMGDPISFTAEGNSISAANTSPLASPDAFTVNDLTNGCLGTGAAGETGSVHPAQLEWGFADWMALWHMANAYELNWYFCNRYTLIKEMVSDVCFFGPYAAGDGVGTSEVAVQQYFRKVNDRYRALASTEVIQPVGFRRYGSVGATAGGNNGLFRATRDYDQAPLTFGGLSNQGMGCSSEPFRKFKCPIILETGKPLGLQLQAVDSFHQGEMNRYLSISEGGMGTPANVSFDATITGTTVTGATVALEQTLDTSPVTIAQQVNTDRRLYKGGIFKFAFLIKGQEFSDDAMISYAKQVASSTGAIYNPIAGSGSVGIAR